MTDEIRVKHQCGSCHGTGLYSGMGESERAAIVCYHCKGQGWQESVFEPFTGRKERPSTEPTGDWEITIRRIKRRECP